MLIRARAAGAGAPRFGVTASRKVGTAVVRNRAKRLAREAYRATRELWANGIDVVVIVRRLDPSMGLFHVTEEWRLAERAIARRTRDALGASEA